MARACCIAGVVPSVVRTACSRSPSDLISGVGDQGLGQLKQVLDSDSHDYPFTMYITVK
jgi:hypothetical protein